MVGIHYIRGGTATSSISVSQQVLVAVPGTKEFRVTPSYANQVLHGHQVVMSYGDSKKVAYAIMPELEDLLKTEEEEQISIQEKLVYLGDDIGDLKADISKRIQPILDYVVRKGIISYDKGQTILYSMELEGEDLEDLIGLVYTALGTSTEEIPPDEDAIKKYIRTGEADEQTLAWLATNVDPIYKKHNEYSNLNARLQQINESGYSILEQALIQTVDAIKAGDEYQGKVVVGNTRINVNERLQQLIGAEPGKYFLLTIDDVVEGESPDGMVFPLQYGPANRTNFPKELKPYFMPTDKLGQIITLFDRTLANLLIVYARQSQEIVRICDEYLKRGINIPDGVFIRAMFPENHKPILILYSDDRLKVVNDEKCRAMMDIVRNERAKIPGRIAEYLEIPEEQIKLEELILLQAQLMQLLPFPVYVCVDMSLRLLITTKRNQLKLTPAGRSILTKYKFYERQLQRDFGVNFDRIFNRTEATIEEAIQLFGEQFAFIRKLRSKTTDLIM